MRMFFSRRPFSSSTAHADSAPAASFDGNVAVEPAQPTVRVSITSRTIWITIGIVIVTALLALLLTKALDAFILLFIAIILAEGLRPLVQALGRLGVPRAPSILLIYLLGLGLLVGLVFLIVGPVVSQSTALANSAPQYISQLQRLVTSAQQAASANPGLSQVLQAATAQAGAALSGFIPALISVPLNIVSFLFDVLLVLTMAFLWLTSADPLKPFVVGLFPLRYQERITALLAELSANIGGYTRGVIVNMLVIATLTSIALSLLGVPYALLLGILAGLFEILPFVGPWISGGVAALVALATGGPLRVVEVLIVFEIIQIVEGNTLVPLVMSRAAKLNPLVVIIAVIMGGSVLGIGGAALAVPIAVVVQLLVMRLLVPLAHSASGTEVVKTPQGTVPEGAKATTETISTAISTAQTTTQTTTEATSRNVAQDAQDVPIIPVAPQSPTTAPTDNGESASPPEAGFQGLSHT